jgi:curved DNA-binding protein CbpA
MRKNNIKKMILYSRIKMDTENLYKFMNLDKDASAELIKSTFITLAKKYHPDKGGDAKLFEKLNKIYSILGNPEKRKIYDSIYEETQTNDHFELVDNFNEAVIDNHVNHENIVIEKPINVDSFKMTPEELKEKIEQYELLRSQEECEFSHQKLDVTKEEFNALFETMRTQNGNSQDIISTEIQETNFVPANTNFLNNASDYLDDETIYDSDTFSKFVNNTEEEFKIPKKVDKKLGSKYCDGKMSNTELKKRMDDMLKERESVTVERTIESNVIPSISIVDNIIAELDDLED